MARIFRWGHFPRAFSTKLESADRGLYFCATIRYNWILAQGELLHPDAVARSLLHETLSSAVGKFRLIEVTAAEAFSNKALAKPLVSDRHLRVEGKVRLAVGRKDRFASRARANRDFDVHAEENLESIRLKMVAERIKDPRLGPVWWVERYSMKAGDNDNPAEAGVKCALRALEEMQHKLRAAEIECEEDDKLYLRRKLDEIFSNLDDPDYLKLATQLARRIADGLLQATGQGGLVENNVAAKLAPTIRNISSELPNGRFGSENESSSDLEPF